MYKLIRPLIFTQDSERMHNASLWLGEHIFSHSPFYDVAGAIYGFDNPVLHTEFLGVKFKNPVGVPAGFDKNARLLDFWPALGLGFVEIGSVTARGGQGNPKPRMFRLPQDLALINRMGLNNIGADAIVRKLVIRNPKSAIPLLINIAKTHDPKILGDQGVEDFCYSFKKLHQFADIMVLNVSCPNTAEGKTFEEPEALQKLLDGIQKIIISDNVAKPVLVKISPDVSLEQLDKILAIAEQHRVAGYVISNISMKARERLQTTKVVLEKIGPKGGVSGEPIRQISTQLIARVYSRLKRPCIIGLGGIESAEGAYEKIKAGASLVQVYSGLIYEGPGLIKQINRGLVKLLARDGFKNIAEAVGIESKRT